MVRAESMINVQVKKPDDTSQYNVDSQTTGVLTAVEFSGPLL